MRRGRRPAACALAAVVLAACAVSGRDSAPLRDAAGNPLAADPDSCLASEAARQYVLRVREKVFAVWEPPPYTPVGDWAVVLLLRFDAAGAVAQVVPAQPDNPLNASALEALERAAPFGPVPPEAICLAETPFMASFKIQVGGRWPR